MENKVFRPQSRKANAARNVVFGVIYKVIVLIVPFVIRSIILRTLGAQYLGLNSLFSSVLQAMSLAELGFGTAMVYSLYKPVAENDTEKVGSLLAFYRMVYRIIGVILLVISLCLLPILPFLTRGECPADVNLYVLFYIYVGNTLVSYFFYAYKQALLTASQRTDIVSKIGSIINILLYLFQIIVLLLTKNYYAYIVALPISTILNNLVLSYFVDKMYPEIKIRGRLERYEIKDISKRVTSLIGHRLSGTIVRTADNIVVSATLGLTVLAMYNNYHSIMFAIIGIVSIINTAITASIGNSIAVEKVEKNHKDFQVIEVLYYWLTMFCVVSFVIISQPFVTIWMGHEMILPEGTVAILGVYLFFYLARQPVLIYKDACGMWWADKYKPYVEAGVNIVLNVILVQILGLAGVIIATIISMAIIAMPWETKVLFKNYFKAGELKYWKNVVWYSCITLVAWKSTSLCIEIINPKDVWENFFVSGVACLVIPNLLFVILMFRTESFKRLKSTIAGFIKR